MFPDSVLLSLTGCENGDTGRLAISKSLKLTKKSPTLFGKEKKSEIAFAYKLNNTWEIMLIAAGFSLHVDTVSAELC